MLGRVVSWRRSIVLWCTQGHIRVLTDYGSMELEEMVFWMGVNALLKGEVQALIAAPARLKLPTFPICTAARGTPARIVHFGYGQVMG